MPLTGTQSELIHEYLSCHDNDTRLASLAALIDGTEAPDLLTSVTAAAELGTLAANIPQTGEADLAPIAGGESPTEAEHNLVVTKVNNILAKLEAAGIFTVV